MEEQTLEEELKQKRHLEYPFIDLSGHHTIYASFSDIMRELSEHCIGLNRVSIIVDCVHKNPKYPPTKDNFKDSQYYSAFVWPVESGYSAMKQMRAFSFNCIDLPQELCYPHLHEFIYDFSHDPEDYTHLIGYARNFKKEILEIVLKHQGNHEKLGKALDKISDQVDKEQGDFSFGAIWSELEKDNYVTLQETWWHLTDKGIQYLNDLQ